MASRSVSTSTVKLERLVDKRAQADRILVARLPGTATRHARWRGPSAEEETAAVAEPRELAAGRGDLRAEAAGVLEGARAREPDEPLAHQVGQLCRTAGAEPEAIPRMDRRRPAPETERGQVAVGRAADYLSRESARPGRTGCWYLTSAPAAVYD